jgi:hypothetical protein
MLRPLRHAFRQLRNSPGFSLTAFLTLSLGIGSCTAIFAVLDAVLLKPLPFAQPDRLVAISPQPWDSVSIPTMQDYLSRSTTLAGIAAYRRWSPKQPAGSATANRILLVNQGFFTTLGTRFALGTGLPISGSPSDCTGQAVVSGAYWKRLNGGAVLGNRQVSLDNRYFQIIGVLPVEQAIEGNYALHQPDVFVQLGCDPRVNPTERGDADFQVFGRLRQQVTPAQAAADLARIDAALREEYPNYYRDLAARLNLISQETGNKCGRKGADSSEFRDVRACRRGGLETSYSAPPYISPLASLRISLPVWITSAKYESHPSRYIQSTSIYSENRPTLICSIPSRLTVPSFASG